MIRMAVASAPVIAKPVVGLSGTGGTGVIAAAAPSATDVYGRLYFAEQWLVQIRAFADALREVAKEEVFIVPAKAAAKVYDELFPGVGIGRDLKLVMVSDGQVLAAGPDGEARFPISAEAVIALEAILIALVDAMPSRPSLKAAG